MASARGALLSRALAFLAAVAVSFALLRAVFPSIPAFVARIDDYRLLFADFALQYHPAAQEISSSGRAYPGYYYPAFFAIVLAPLGALPLADASRLWGGVQIAGTLGLALLAARAAQRVVLGAVAVVLVLTSAPVLHGFKWGQVSALIALLAFAASGAAAAMAGPASGTADAARARRGSGASRRIAGSLSLALATAIKIYPAVFLVVPLARRDVRFVAAFFGWLALLALAIPILVLGPERALEFHRDVRVGWQADAPRHAADPNSQYFPHVVERWTIAARGPFAPIDAAPSTLRRALAIGGLALAVGFAGLAAAAVVRRVESAGLRSALLLFGAIPFVVPTTWPHYLMHIPIAQALAARDLLDRRSGHAWLPALVFLLSSIAIGSVLPIALGMKWRSYVYLGGPFLASTLVQILTAVLLLPKLREARRTDSARAGA